MNIQNIYELMDRFEGSSITELELELEGARIALKKGGGQNPTISVPIAVQAEKPVPECGAEKVQVREKQEEISGTAIEAPLVGTFYAAASPESAPFVTVGQKVKKGDVVGIIEAMKLMNEITAPCDGIIESIHVQNGQMVEYRQILMRVK